MTALLTQSNSLAAAATALMAAAQPGKLRESWLLNNRRSIERSSLASTE